ncbi:hypothetical protein BGZ74_004552, partial [Mortierella antarctica]
MDWPDKTFDCQTVANAIQKAKAKASHYDGSEAAELFKILQSKAHEDKDWFVATELDSKGRLQRMFWMISGETTLDYEWILQKLLEANNNTTPQVILVDKDLAMEAACANIIKSTILLNCIWHLGHQNLNRNLHGALGKDWEAFISSFWVAWNAITEQEFEHRWLKDVTVFGAGKPKVQVYLDRIFQHREHWAWPWVGTRFTAFIMQMFSDVIDVNKHYLGLAASSQMKMEMMWSVYYHASLYDPEVAHEYAAKYSVEQLKLANANEE